MILTSKNLSYLHLPFVPVVYSAHFIRLNSILTRMKEVQFYSLEN